MVDIHVCGDKVTADFPGPGHYEIDIRMESYGPVVHVREGEKKKPTEKDWERWADNLSLKGVNA